MQVAEKPSRLPVVIALLALLAFCLTVPGLWRLIGDSTEGPTIRPHRAGVLPASETATMARSLAPSGPSFLAETWPSSYPQPFVPPAADLATVPTLQPFLIGPPPATSFEDFLVAISAPVQHAPFHQGPAAVGQIAAIDAGLFPPLPNERQVMWPVAPEVLAAVSIPREGTSPPPAALGSPVMGTARMVGRAVAECADAVHEQVSVWMRATADIYRASAMSSSVTSSEVAPGEPISSLPAAEPASTLRLTDPADRLAMIPQEPEVGVQEHSGESTAPPNATRTVWATPDALIDQLYRLSHHPYSRRWAYAALDQLSSLAEDDSRQWGRSAALLAGLSESATEAVRLADASNDEGLRVELYRAHWGIVRRLDCWTAMNSIRQAAISESRLAYRGPQAGMLRNVPNLADEEQQLGELSSGLESYEQSRDAALGRRLAQLTQDLGSSPSDLKQGLADAVDEHYRNANVRLAVTAEMINRYLSEERIQSQPIHERIAGTPVRGHSTTQSQSRVELQPAVGHWHIDLITQGVVESDTSSIGRAKVFTRGDTQFIARKPLVVAPSGVWTEPAAASAENCNRLVGVSTGVDWIPLIGELARSQAARQYRAKRPRAKAEVEHKVSTRTTERVDAETVEMVWRVQGQVEDRLTDPLEKYGIELTPIELTTTSERAVARLRLAGYAQLAAHTPRPQALSDSLASFQIHETALTNAAFALELNGERLTAAELQARLREKLPRLAQAEPPEAPQDTVFQFAPMDAIQFHIAEGRLEITIAVTQFTQGRQQIRDFVVHTTYAPVVSGLTAELVRESRPSFEPKGRPIGAGDRARLQNVFDAVLSEDRRLPIIRPEDSAGPRLAGLMITQLVLEDGWIGLAIGPERDGRVAQRERSLW